MWVIFFYPVYDIGASFYNQNLLLRTMTNDPGERSKLLIGPRLWVMIRITGRLIFSSSCAMLPSRISFSFFVRTHPLKNRHLFS